MHTLKNHKKQFPIRFKLLLILLLTVSVIKAQNIVPNPGFEGHSGLPDSYGDWGNCHFWFNCAGEGSPDYLHTGGSSVAQLPNSGLALVTPYEGEAIMGISTYRGDYLHREYITATLTSPMIIGQTYVVSFRMTNGFSGWYSGAGTNHVGVYFSTSFLVQVGTDPIDVTPQLEIPGVVWTEEWTYYEFLFTPETSFSHITFGNFYGDDETDVTVFKPAAINATRSEYLFDDIYVGLMVTPPVIFIDTTLCSGNTYTLPDGSITSTAITDTTVLLTAGGVDSTIITHVEFLNEITVAQSAHICADEQYILPDGNTVNSAGIYTTVLPAASGCDSIITTTLTQTTTPDITLLIPEFICLDAGNIQLEAYPEGGVFSGPGVIADQFDPLLAGGAGSYTITYTYVMNECSFIQQTNIQVEQNYADAGADQTIQFGSRVNLHAVCGGDIIWSPAALLNCADCADPEALLNQNTTFVLTSVNNYGCIAIDSVTIIVIHENPDDFFVPNTFTPNNDGLNDYFSPLGLAIETIVHFEVFNRWGECIYRAENIAPGNNSGWDGTYHGAPVQEGVYIYTVEVKYVTGIIAVKSGNVTVLK